MASEAQKRASAKYDAAKTKQVHLKLNTETDADILEKLARQGSVQGYIKTLIRLDMKGAPKMLYVTSIDIRSNGEYGDEDTICKCQTVEEAKKEARVYWEHLSDHDKKRTEIEIREYAEDIEDEDCDCFDYDTIEWR